MSYLQNKKFSEFFLDLNLFNIKLYMYNLLSCLENIHKHGIVHRDLKPDNFLYDIDNHKCLLIDFGLSEAVRELILSLK
jgi:cell division control protein 7